MKGRVQSREGILVDAARWKTRNRKLVPVADVDESVRKEQFFDVLEDFFFLLVVRS
jgi:hypothetical protein